MDPLSAAIKKNRADAYVMYASSRDADMRYLTQFTTSDPFVFFKKPGEKGTIIISQMEVGRASRESPAAVMTRAEAGLPGDHEKRKRSHPGNCEDDCRAGWEKDPRPPQFPTGTCPCSRRLLLGFRGQRNGSVNESQENKGGDCEHETGPESDRNCPGTRGRPDQEICGKKRRYSTAKECR